MKNKIFGFISILSLGLVLNGTMNVGEKSDGNDFQTNKIRKTGLTVDQRGRIRSIPDRILVKYRKQADLSTQAFIKTSIEASHGIQEIKHFLFIDVYLYRTFWNKDKTLEELNKSPFIEFAEPDYKRYADSKFPNDPFFNKLWGLHNTGQSGGETDADMDAPEAWDLSTGSRNVIVGVIDSGVDYNHEDLADNMWTNPGETPNNGLDDDGNGYVDDYHGINAIKNTGNPMDDDGHGSHVSGTIAAVGNNGKGVVGVCWKAKIMALKFLGAQGGGSVSDEIECIQYAINKGANVLNGSIGGYDSSNAEKSAIKKAKDAGILCIFAAGNDGTNNDSKPHYPSSYDLDNIIAVAATSRSDNLLSWSNYGSTSVDIAAPGRSILSTITNNNYDTYSGTSMATPQVAGLAALIKSYNSTLTWQQLKENILSGGDEIASFKEKILSGKRINARNSLGTIRSHTISGKVKTEDGKGLSGVTVCFTQESCVKTDSNGFYSKSVNRGWSGTSTPFKANYAFNPANRSYSNVRSNKTKQDFTASLAQYVLRIRAGTGGTTDPQPGSYKYGYRSKATITAKPNADYRFTKWTGDASGTANPLSVTMDSSKSIKANFIRQYELTINSGDGGTTDPSPGTHKYDKGTDALIAAIPDAHYRFTKWTGDASGTANPLSITMNSKKSIKSHFTRIIYPPLNFTGEKMLDRSLSLAEYINVMKWERHPNNDEINIVLYKIYQVGGNGRELLVELSADTFEYWHRAVVKDKQYQYVIVAVDDSGREGDPATITVN